ncbi:MAG: DUF3256 family protein [Prevotella sp.]|uniref:DUF3256 family protein n=1 Tax=Prevotella sp. TaxID=59823 RepID=UPI002A2CC356|nr:DUF3256 family protein [Prevotella sp.]MDD7318278.1 DUF3256 family protein [Prevotellaceae bacterium]MDY4019718.1 DUF3256 family protein [Prevotella sp.]
MKKQFFLTTLFIIVLSSAAYAQATMRDIWINMPDSVAAYLDKDKRTEMADLYASQMKAEVKNNLDGISVLDKMTDDYVFVTLNGSSTLQLKKLAYNDSFVICMVKSFKAPEPESEIFFFDAEWQPENGTFGLPITNDENVLKRDFINKPDSMSQEDFDDLLPIIDPFMLVAELSETEPVVTLTLSKPLLTSEETGKVIAIIKQRKFKWSGYIFTEC